MRILVLLALATALGGCTNRVISYRPLLERDRAVEATFRGGVWASPEPGCVFNAQSPVQSWPECANPTAIVRGSFSAREFLAAGEPLIVQSRFRPDQEPTHFAYTAIEPVSRDAEGRVTAYTLWFVECGPPDIVGEGESREVRVTRSPLPGLTLKGDNCVAHSEDAVRGAARASRAWSMSYTQVWMRALRPSDKARPHGWSVDPLAMPRKLEEAPAADPL